MIGFIIIRHIIKYRKNEVTRAILFLKTDTVKRFFGTFPRKCYKLLAKMEPIRKTTLYGNYLLRVRFIG